jgi:isopentenyl-diphosphate delta-isomerase
VWITPTELINNLKKTPEKYCPWMLIALYLLPFSEMQMLTKHKTILSEWIKNEIKNALKISIKFHLPDNNWRLVN